MSENSAGETLELMRKAVVRCRIMRMDTEAYDISWEKQPFMHEGTKYGFKNAVNKIESDNFGYYEKDGKVYRY